MPYRMSLVVNGLLPLIKQRSDGLMSYMEERSRQAQLGLKNAPLSGRRK
jgi:hypothetical protein